MTTEERRAYLITKKGEDPASILEGQINTEPPPPANLSDEECRAFSDLMSKMLRYEPKDSITIEEVLQHTWLRKHYDDLEAENPWILRFHWGHETRDTKAGRWALRRE